MSRKKRFQKYYPDERQSSSFVIDYEALYQEGYRGLIYDIDNTLVPHGAPADDRAVELFARLKSMGFQVMLLSNNKRSRVEPFAKAVGADFVSMANKPFVKNYLFACEKMHLEKKQVIFVGDQLFTDVLGAKKAGIRNILVDPINPKEEIQIVIKRWFEKIVLREYDKNLKA